MYHVSKEDWKKVKEYSQEVENLTKNYGLMPTSKKIQEMPNFKCYIFIYINNTILGYLLKE